MQRKIKTETVYEMTLEEAKVVKSALDYTYHRITTHNKGPVNNVQEIDRLRKILA